VTSCFGFATLVAVPCGWQLDFVGQAAEPERFAGVINLKALRVIRVTRIVKAVRLMRIFRFVMALRTLITSILHTLQSLFWALALLVLIVYVFAVSRWISDDCSLHFHVD
jgi:hypothetical protein